MRPCDIEATLRTMTVLVDTREQPTERAIARYKSMGREIRRVTLNYGDYAADAVLPDGNHIYDVESVIHPISAVIERKMSLDELAACFTTGRKRFVAEFERAKAHGCRVYLLVEGGSWEDVLHGMYKTKVSSKALLASITAFMVRYDAQIIFCAAKTSGQMIAEVLYRDLKERLERGDYG